MDFFELLRNKSKIIYITLIITSIFNALSNLLLLNFINNRIAGIPLPIVREYEWLLFALLIVFTFTLNKVFESYMIKLANEVKFDYQQRIHRKLEQSEFNQFEQLGTARVYTAINDSQQLAVLPKLIMTIINSTIIIAVCIIYLFINSFWGALMVLSVMIFLLILYFMKNSWIEKDLRLKRDLRTQYYSYIDDLLNGFKEIRASSVRNFNIHQKFLNENIKKIRHIDEKTLIKYNDNELSAKFSWYIVIGIILFLGPSLLDLDNKIISFFMITILFMIGPIADIVGSLQNYTEIKIVLGRQKEFDSILATIQNDSEADVEKFSVHKPAQQFVEIVISDVTYNYYNLSRQIAFSVGPINLKIKRGELIFIHGGNGSGKSTFINLLTGLYKPQTGDICINESGGRKKYLASFSDYIAPVFTSAYLFNENYEDYILDLNGDRLKFYLQLFHMENVIKFDKFRNVIRRDLSKGQQKRLALILALMEEKSIIVLDEWAAEQDPEFRSYFYRTILRELQREGKTIIAVTHDDGYFDCADRLIRFDFGRITSDVAVKNEKIEDSVMRSI